MFPVDTYAMIQRRQEELLKQAERERLARAARPAGVSFHRKSASWLAMHLMRWGQRLDSSGKCENAQPVLPASPHH